MNSKQLSKRMCYVSKNYFDSAMILEKNLFVCNNNNIIYPIVYLLRHSLELILKSLILQDINLQHIDIKKPVIYYSRLKGKNFDISRTHSLVVLFDRLVDIDNAKIEDYDQLVGFHKDTIKELKNLFSTIDDIDYNGDMYRYPISKKGIINNMEFIEKENKEDSLVFGEIKPHKIGHFIFGSKENDDFGFLKHVYIKDEDTYKMKNRLKNVIYRMIDYSQYKKIFV